MNIEQLIKCLKKGGLPPEQKKYRRIVFTINNYKQKDEDIIWNNYVDENYISYFIYGREKAPTTGTKHLQGYIEFSKQVSFNAIKSIHGKMYFAPAKGNYSQNYNYCTKDGDYLERGFAKKQGARTDIIKIKEMVNKNIPMIEILNECENFQQMKIAEKLYQYKKIDIKTRNVPEVIYVYGKSGSGKTQYAHDICDKDSTWEYAENLEWFDGYDQDNDVLLNDFRDNDCKYNLLLKLLDGYQRRVKIKGAFTIWNPKRIIFTSIIHPTNLYKGVQEREDNIYQLLRRITKFIEMDNFFNPIDKTKEFKNLIDKFK